MLIVDEIVVRYPRFTLGPVSLQLQAGERVALLGRNGAGKSTLLALMAGQRHADAGQVSWRPASSMSDVHARHEPDERLLLRQSVAYVGAALQALPWYKVRQHFDFLQRIHERWNAARAMDLARALRLDLDAATGTLSRGNLVKLNLCAGWAQEASVLLLDEPTAGLDPVARVDMLRELELFLEQQVNTTVVYATHLLDELKGFAPERLLVLSDGAMREYSRLDSNNFDVATMTELMMRAGRRENVEVSA
ncbi:ATP-binding cassette domain-containing protein [Gemmatimonas sp.]